MERVSSRRRSLAVIGAAVVVAGSAAVWAADPGTGYVVDRNGEAFRTRDGDCVVTRVWEPSLSIPACHPQFIQRAQAQPAEVAAVAPRRVSQFITLETDTLFDFDEAQLRDTGREKLDRIVQMARDANQPKISIVGYTDRIGSEQYNLDLSRRRAETVRDYLIDRGVEPGVVEVAARGEDDPVVQCEGVQGNELIRCLQPNRRSEVEFSALETIEVPAEPGSGTPPLPTGPRTR